MVKLDKAENLRAAAIARARIFASYQDFETGTALGLVKPVSGQLAVRRVFGFIALVLLFQFSLSSVSAKDLGAYKIGDTVTEDVRTPVPLTVIDPEGAKIQPEQAALRVPAIFQFSPDAANEAEIEFRSVFAGIRAKFLSELAATFNRRQLDEQTTASARFQRLIGSFRLQNTAFPLSTNLLEIWAHGESDVAIHMSLAVKLRGIMGRYTRPDALPQDIKLGGQARILTNTGGISTLEIVEKNSALIWQTNLYTLAEAREELERSFPPEERLSGKFLASFLRENCLLDAELTRQVRASRGEPVYAANVYEARQLIARRGETVDSKIKAAFDQLREKLQVRQLQQQASEAGQRSQQAHQRNLWLWSALPVVLAVLLFTLWRSNPRKLAQTLLPARMANLLRANVTAKPASQPTNLSVAQQTAALEKTGSGQRPGAAQPILQDRLRNSQKQIEDLEKDLAARNGQEEHELIPNVPVNESGQAQKQKLDCALQLARTVSLDFNNALTAILGHTSLVLSQMEPNHVWRASLVEVEKSAAKAAEIASDLGTFSSQEKDLRTQTVGNVNALLQHAAKLFQGTHPGKAKWSLQLAQKLYAAKFQEAKILQVFLKLLENALDATSGDGQISVQSYNVELAAVKQDGNVRLDAGTYVCAEIADNGCGIAPEILPRIFEPFFTTKPGDRRGLGLAYVYGIVTNLGGSVAVSSELGAGTSVRVYLPAKKRVVRNDTSGIDDLNGNQTVLIVDDEDLLLTMGQTVLSAYGYRVLTANCGERAVEILAQNETPIDVVLTDLVMPNMSGRVLVEHVRRLSPNSRIIRTSGYVWPNGQEDDVDYLQKPFTSQELLLKVKHALSASEPASVECVA